MNPVKNWGQSKVLHSYEIFNNWAHGQLRPQITCHPYIDIDSLVEAWLIGWPRAQSTMTSVLSHKQLFLKAPTFIVHQLHSITVFLEPFQIQLWIGPSTTTHLHQYFLYFWMKHALCTTTSPKVIFSTIPNTVMNGPINKVF